MRNYIDPWPPISQPRYTEQAPRLPPTARVQVRAVGGRRFYADGRTVELGAVATVDVDVAQSLVALGRAEYA